MTVAPLPGGRVRVAFSRDEKRDRPAALPPRRWQVGPRVAALPVDPPSGGTWLAVNDAGLVLAVLNVNPGARPAGATANRSRGELIPALLGCASPAEAVAALPRVFDYADFAPFRLVLVGSGVAAEVRWDGATAMVSSRLLAGRPLLYTSSGLGDHLVEEVRRSLFEDAFGGPAEEWATAQDDYHRHTIPGVGHLSVNMARPDARTVSYAVVAVGDDGAEFAYHPDAPGRTAVPATVTLALAGGAA